jgi:elongation factor Ts
MQITAQMVKELRERTGAGMMDCKKALKETGGDLDAAIEHMRKTGLAKAEKKAGRTAAEGLVVIERSSDGRRAVMLEVNCETDFVARGDDFKGFAAAVAKRIMDSAPVDVEALSAMPLEEGSDTSVEVARQALVAKIGENMSVRRFVTMDVGDGRMGQYLHGTRIGVLVSMRGGDDELAKDMAMHVAASRPQVVNPEQVPEQVVAKEKEIFVAQARDSGKPDKIIEKMIGGKLRKFLDEVSLVGQPFVKDPDTKVGKLLQGKGAEVLGFERFEVGEGIEKKSESFADEVMAQAKS